MKVPYKLEPQTTLADERLLTQDERVAFMSILGVNYKPPEAMCEAQHAKTLAAVRKAIKNTYTLKDDALTMKQAILKLFEAQNG